MCGEFGSFFSFFEHFSNFKVILFLLNILIYLETWFFKYIYPYTLPKILQVPRILHQFQNIYQFVKNYENPEKSLKSVKKKSHTWNNALINKSLCTKLLYDIMKICTQGFLHISNHFRVTFFFDKQIFGKKWPFSLCFSN